MAKNVTNKTIQRAVDGGLWQTYTGPDTQGPTAPAISAFVQVSSDPTALDITWAASQDARSPPITSYQLQITTAADAGFASPVQTNSYAATAAGIAQRLTGLTTSTAYIARVRGYDSASTPNASNWSSTGSQSTPAGLTSGLTYGINHSLAAYLQYGPNYGTAGDSAEERINRAANRWVVLHWQPGVTSSQLQTHINAIHAENPDCKCVIYTTFSRELNTSAAVWNTLRNKVINWSAAGDLWARTTFPSGPVVVGFGTTNAVNQAGTRLDSVDGLTWSEWSMKWFIDTYGAGAMSFVDGVMWDNVAVWDLGYDYNEDGVSNSPSSLAMRQAQTASMLRRSEYTRARKPDWFTVMNGVQESVRRQWQYSPGIEDIAADIGRVKSLGIDAGIYEYPTGYWHSPNGIFWYEGVGVLSSMRTYPANATVSSPPATGTLLCNAFGGWDTNINGATTLVGQSTYLKNAVEIVHASQLFSDPRNMTWQCMGPGPQRIGVWSRVGEHIRWCATFPAVLGGWSMQYMDIENRNKMIILDELAFEWGEPIDPPAIETGMISGAYQRRFRTSTYDVLALCRPIFKGTQGTVNLLAPRSGHQWYRIDASDYGNQDPAVNDGSLEGSTLSNLTEHNGIVLVSAP